MFGGGENTQGSKSGKAKNEGYVHSVICFKNVFGLLVISKAGFKVDLMKSLTNKMSTSPSVSSVCVWGGHSPLYVNDAASSLYTRENRDMEKSGHLARS